MSVREDAIEILKHYGQLYANKTRRRDSTLTYAIRVVEMRLAQDGVSKEELILASNRYAKTCNDGYMRCAQNFFRDEALVDFLFDNFIEPPSPQIVNGNGNGRKQEYSDAIDFNEAKKLLNGVKWNKKHG